MDAVGPTAKMAPETSEWRKLKTASTEGGLEKGAMMIRG
jgi:hypothetical protein